MLEAVDIHGSHDADLLLAELRGASVVIPPKANRKIKHAYKWQHMVENFFAKIGHF